MTCLGCGHDNPLFARYCNHCGNKMATAPLAQPQPRPVQDELKIATVMFADLSGFTAWAERYQPEIVADVLRHCFEGIERAIRRFGGTVVKYVGDSVIGSFGVPTMVEDHAVRALLAAQEILAFLERYNREWEREKGWCLSWRIGIHAGDVWVGQVGGKLDLVGSTVNLANRLEQHCPPGQVLVSEAVRRLALGRFDFEPAGPLLLKGIDRPIHAHVLKGQCDRPQETHSIPLVGRDTQLQRLESMLARLYHGIGGSIAVTGEAGIGKSRLLAELRRRMLVQHPFHWLEAKGESWAQQLPYGVVTKLVRRFWPVEAPSDAAQALVSLFDPSGEAVQEELRDEIGRALRELLHREARRQGGMVLVLDDLQWADEPSLHALSYLLSGLSRVPLLVVTVFRPTPALSGRMRGGASQELLLPPLTDGEALLLLKAQLGGEVWPEEALLRIVARSEGNPLFLEEVAKSILESGTLPPASGASVPDAIRGILAARLDRLEEPAKALLQLASVVGRRFPRRLVEDLAPTPQGAAEAVRQLIQARLIRETEPGEFAFKNGFTQEVVYQSLLQRPRQQLHLAIADWWERNEGSVELLAWHYRLAGANERAFPLLLQAATRARTKGAPGEALAFLEQGLEVSGHVQPQELAGVYTQIGEIRLAMGETEAGVTAFQQALALHSGRRAQVVKKNEPAPSDPRDWVEIDQLLDPES